MQTNPVIPSKVLYLCCQYGYKIVVVQNTQLMSSLRILKCQIITYIFSGLNKSHRIEVQQIMYFKDLEPYFNQQATRKF